MKNLFYVFCDSFLKNQLANKIFAFLLFLFLLLPQYACNTTEPIEDIPPGKRNYVWSIDSVDYGNLPSTIQLESIWGSSPGDVWGANGDAPDVRDCLWHYDGVKWTRATEGTPITEFTGNKVVYSVWGTAQNNVWAFGRKINQGTLSAFIMHYNGSLWTDVTPANVAVLSANLYCVYGTAANNIWVGGYEYALHYNGVNWDTCKVADSLTIVSIAGNSTSLFFELGSPWGIDVSVIYRKIENIFKLLDWTKISEQKFGALLWVIDNKLISFANGVISTKLDQSGNLDSSGWYREFSTTTYFSQRYVQSKKNVFAVGQWNLAYHFNGTDWAKIDINVPNHTVDTYALFWGVWTNGKEVFISDTQNGIIYHGK
jgi:hypothetical protein